VDETSDWDERVGEGAFAGNNNIKDLNGEIKRHLTNLPPFLAKAPPCLAKVLP
jgi:hypothetical protein